MPGPWRALGTTANLVLPASCLPYLTYTTVPSTVESPARSPGARSHSGGGSPGRRTASSSYYGSGPRRWRVLVVTTAILLALGSLLAMYGMSPSDRDVVHPYLSKRAPAYRRAVIDRSTHTAPTTATHNANTAAGEEATSTLISDEEEKGKERLEEGGAPSVEAAAAPAGASTRTQPNSTATTITTPTTSLSAGLKPDGGGGVPQTAVDSGAGGVGGGRDGGGGREPPGPHGLSADPGRVVRPAARDDVSARGGGGGGLRGAQERAEEEGQLSLHVVEVPQQGGSVAVTQIGLAQGQGQGQGNPLQPLRRASPSVSGSAGRMPGSVPSGTLTHKMSEEVSRSSNGSGEGELGGAASDGNGGSGNGGSGAVEGDPASAGRGGRGERVSSRPSVMTLDGGVSDVGDGDKGCARPLPGAGNGGGGVPSSVSGGGALHAAREALTQYDGKGIPRIIHQMYGLFDAAATPAPPPPRGATGGRDNSLLLAAGGGGSGGPSLSVSSWRARNPNHTHILWGAGDVDQLVEDMFPAFAAVWRSPAFRRLPVLRADLARYLLVFAFGGVYADTDTICSRPVDGWTEGWGANVSAIVGVEADAGSIPDWWRHWPRQLQFCQWTFAAAPAHPLLAHVVFRIARLLSSRGPTAPALSSSDVVHVTGPAVMTDAVYDYLASKGRNWTEFVGLSRGVQVGDLALLPLTAFSPGVGHMGAGGLGHPEARVQHLFRGSWQRQGVGGGGRRSWRRLR